MFRRNSVARNPKWNPQICKSESPHAETLIRPGIGKGPESKRRQSIIFQAVSGRLNAQNMCAQPLHSVRIEKPIKNTIYRRIPIEIPLKATDRLLPFFVAGFRARGTMEIKPPESVYSEYSGFAERSRQRAAGAPDTDRRRESRNKLHRAHAAYEEI